MIAEPITVVPSQAHVAIRLPLVCSYTKGQPRGRRRRRRRHLRWIIVRSHGGGGGQNRTDKAATSTQLKKGNNEKKLQQMTVERCRWDRTATEARMRPMMVLADR